MLMMAIGPKSLELAGRLADGVVLHTFFTDETLARAVRTVRESAERAGKDPAGVRIWSVLATVEESIPEEQRLRKLVGRLATYLQGYGEVLVRANGWDPAALERFRNDELVQGYPGAFDAIGTVEELSHLRDDVLPSEWLEASATGSAAEWPGASRTSSTPVRTAWCCTARPRPSSRRSWPRGARCDRTGWTGSPTTPDGCSRPATGRTAPAGRARPRSPRPCGPTRAARSRRSRSPRGRALA